MCAVRGGPQPDVRHPSTAPGARRRPPPPPPGMHTPPARPSPRPLHLRQLPERFTRLGRSPEAEKPDRVWTVRGEAGAPGPNDVIITDICLNHKPELTLSTCGVRPPRDAPLQHLSVGDLQKQVGHVPFSQRHLLQQQQQVLCPAPEAQQDGCSLLGAARTFLGRLVTLLRSGALCSRAECQPDGARQAEAGHEEQGGAAMQQQAPQQQTQQQQQEAARTRGNPSLSPAVTGARRAVTPELVISPEKELKAAESPWAALGQLVRMQGEGRAGSSSADPVYLSPGASTVLHTSPDGGSGLRAVHSLLDIQRDKERALLHPTRYLDDLRVLYNIHRRELVSQLVYREAGQIFQREGGVGEPRPLRRVIGSPTHSVTQDDLMTRQSKERLIRKIASLRPVVSRRLPEPEPCWSGSDFVQACLTAHNIYRARHSAPPLTLSTELCRQAQAWVNHLAHTGTFRHRGEPGLGENLFCRNTALILRGRTSVMPDISGEEVAAYWYSSVRQYKFNRPPNVLQASQGPFTQLVWGESREFGVGKARSRSGKIIVVAHYAPAGNIENAFKENVLPLNTRALAAEILGEIPGLTSLEQVDGRVAERVMGLLAAQPPRLAGRNATKVIAAHLLGHTASVITTPEEELQVVINRYASPGREARKRASSRVNPLGVPNSLSMIPEASCCPPRFRLRTRASVSPADVQSGVIHESSEAQGDEEAIMMRPSRHWLEPQSPQMGDDGDDGPTEVIELKRGDLGSPSSDMDDIRSASLSASPRNSSKPKRPRLGRGGGEWTNGTNSENSDLETIRSESFDSVDSQSHPEPINPDRCKNVVIKEPQNNVHNDPGAPGMDKYNLDLKLPFEVPDAEHGQMNCYALSPMRY
nr:uncharacterized protein LOC123766162 isoform X2 [Procambarus clarkii]